MQISKETLKILKNFSSIENSIYVDEKKILKIINSSSSIIGVAEIEDELGEFGIYNLSAFIQVLTMFDEPELEFQQSKLIVKSGKRKIEYRLTPKDLVPFKAKASKAYTEGTKVCDATFNLTEEQLNGILKVSRVIGCDVIEINIDNGKGTLHLRNTKNSSNDTYTEDITGERSGNVNLFVSNLDLLPGGYTVSVVNNKFAKFQNNDMNVFYIVTAFIG